MRRTALLLLTLVLATTTGVALILAAGTGPASPDGDTVARANRATVHRFYTAVNDALRTGGAPALDGLVAPDLVRPGSRAGDERRARFRQALHRLTGDFAGLQLSVDTVIAGGDQAVAVVSAEGSRLPGLPGLLVHDPSMRWQAIDRFVLDDGTIVALDHWDQGRSVASVLPLVDATLDRLPAAPAAIDVARFTVAPGAHLPGLLGLGPELLFLEAGTLAVDVTGRARVRRASEAAATTAHGAIELAPGDLLALPAGTPFTIHNTGQGPAVILGVSLRAVAMRSAENDGLDAPALSLVRTSDISVQHLARGLVPDLPPGPATIVGTDLILAPGAGIGRHEVAGAELVAVEAGTLALTIAVGEGQLARTTGPEVMAAPAALRAGGESPGREGTLFAGDGAMLPRGAVYAIGNAGADPLVTLVVRITPSASEPR